MAGTWKAIQDRVYVLLEADTSLRTLTGHASGDKRIYNAHDVAHELTSTKPAYLVLYERDDAPPEQKRETFNMQVQVLALGLTRAKDCGDRVEAVLHRQALAATGWTDVSMLRRMRRSRYDDRYKCWQVDIDIQIRAF